ncbi:MAG: endolytic transglycosylase MltG [Spirochaetes bacterium]|nr:endolytic transglycosylase MltG [Spirochaetota bacterium]MBU1081339.1 endolytic transglycosylase MltG [Spirochaetota bacterium]
MRNSKPNDKRSIASILFRVLGTLVALAIVIAAAALIAALAFASAYDKPTGKIGPEGAFFNVRQGESGMSVSRRLAQEGFIRSEYLFRLILKAKRLESSLKAGEYAIGPAMNSSDVLEMLVEGRQALLRLTVPEGADIGYIADAAEAAGVASASDTLAAARDGDLVRGLGIPAESADGYLFPDTYLLPRNAGGRALVTLMVQTFKKRLAEAIPEALALSPKELHERVVLASIVEREYRVAQEAPLMASVFLNRLRIGMALQSCATVVFVITEHQGKPHPSRLFDRDLKIDDPFNTYMYPGLPPGPICNPGMTAVSAALRPAVSKYLYFRLVNEATGQHYFSASLDEHIGAASLLVKPRSR